MRKIVCCLLLFSLHTSFLFSQEQLHVSKAKSWSVNDPLQNHVFVKSYGQFDNWIKLNEKIEYGVFCSDKILFTKTGGVFMISNPVPVTEEERDYAEQNKRAKKQLEKKNRNINVEFNWLNTNQDVRIEGTQKVSCYYTYGEKGYEQVKAEGYKVITYKNLYPKIDCEYMIPEGKGGIKYKLILHPGADPSVIKLKYSGDVQSISLNKDNVVIRTKYGDVIDHAPVSFYKESGTSVGSSFKLSNGVISFQLETTNTKQETIVIDPWTVIPVGLTVDSAAHDIDYDANGNVYVSGGTYPFKVIKYSALGVPLWVFTVPIGWSSGNYYSRFCVLPYSGSLYWGEGFNYSPGPSVLKLNSSGVMIMASPYMIGNNEIWTMFYNGCTKQLIGFGGGTDADNNMKIIADTNLSGHVSINFNGYTSYSFCNDVASVAMDDNGNFYALMSSLSNSSTGHLQKSLLSGGYNPPCAFDVNTGIDLEEDCADGIPGYNNITVKANVLAINNSYVFLTSGASVYAYSNTTGALLAAHKISAAYDSICFRSHEGIAADDCNNVYVSGTNKVHTFFFTGTSFIPMADITNGITGEVYDIRLDKYNNVLYVCGKGFATVTDAIYCDANPMILTDSVVHCNGYANFDVTGGMSPYTYLWSTGDTTSYISGVTGGMYYITVTDNSCNLNQRRDSVFINPAITVSVSGDTLLCTGEVSTLTAVGAANYTWSPATGLSTTTGNVVMANPATTVVYTVVGNTNVCSGTDSIKVKVNPSPLPNLGNDTIFCNIHNYLLDAGNPGDSYSWSTGDTTQTVSATQNVEYIVTVSNIYNCLSIDSIHLIFAAPPFIFLGPDTTLCPGTSVTFDAGNVGAVYQWTNGATTQTITVSAPGNYGVTAQIGTCVDRDTVNVSVVPTIDLGPELSLCNGEKFVLNAGIYNANYLWSTGDTTQFITIEIPAEYSVVVHYKHCTLSDSVELTGGYTSLFVPNTFTPNNDDKNESFRAYGEGITSANMKIFTRWGELIFESDDMNAGWDGTFNGNRCPQDVYTYLFDYTTVCGGTEIYRRPGQVLLLR